MQVIGRGSPAPWAVIEDHVTRPQVSSQREQGRFVAGYLLLNMPPMDDRKMPVQDWIRIAGDDEFLSVFESYFFGGQVLGAQETLPRLNGCLIHARCCAADSSRVVLDYDKRAGRVRILQ